MSEMENEGKGKKKLLIAVIVGIAVIALTVGFLLWWNSTAQKIRRELRAAGDFREQQDYQQAVSAYNRVLNMDPINQEAYDGLVGSYCSWAQLQETWGSSSEAVNIYKEVLRLNPLHLEAHRGIAQIYEKQGDYIAAVDFLEGQRASLGESFPSEAVSMLAADYMILAAEAAERGENDRQKAYLEKTLALESQNAQAQEELNALLAWEELMASVQDICLSLADAAAAGDMELLCELAAQEELAELLEQVGTMDTDGRLLTDTESGRIGIYQVDNADYAYMIYCGDYAGDNREGSGVWIGATELRRYIACGEWKADQPEGEQSVKTWSTLLPDAVTVQMMEGAVTGGLWDGTISWGYSGPYGEREWYVEMDEGTVVPAAEPKLNEEGGVWIVWSAEPYVNRSMYEPMPLGTDDPHSMENRYGIEGFAICQSEE